MDIAVVLNRSMRLVCNEQRNKGDLLVFKPNVDPSQSASISNVMMIYDSSLKAETCFTKEAGGFSERYG